MRKSVVCAVAALGVLLWIEADAQERQERVNLAVAHRIREESFGRNSKVMDTAFQLTDVHGPRLTGSPAARRAGEWAVSQLKAWGLANATLDPWGPFGRGWSCTRFTAMMKTPEFQPIIGFSLPWTPGTDGAVTGEAVMASFRGRSDFDKWRGKLKGKIVIGSPPRPMEMITEPLSFRLTDEELKAEAEAPEPSSGNPATLPLGFLRGRRAPAGGRGGGPGGGSFRSELNQFLKDEGVLVVLTPGAGPGGGTVMGQGVFPRDPMQVAPPPSVVVTPEHYNRIARLLEKNVPVTLEFDIHNEFTEPGDSFNVIADIPGAAPDAGLVMLGGHFDSWTGGTGATDNAAGASVTMEAMRILKALDLKMQRTVRVALWTGEEEGELGSRAYVKKHFADPDEMQPKPEYARLAAYYNLDNGSGKIRGVYMQNNDEVRPIFQAWLDPFKDLGAATLTIRNTGSTDHMAFDAVGLPGFEFIQDPLEYGSRTHHSNMDVYDELQANDLEQAAAVMAWFAYNTAVRPEMLPRKPMPKPGAAREGR
jgi:carboxypeptidase Q